jgi:hypothetical protein
LHLSSRRCAEQLSIPAIWLFWLVPDHAIHFGAVMPFYWALQSLGADHRRRMSVLAALAWAGMLFTWAAVPLPHAATFKPSGCFIVALMTDLAQST